MVLRDEPEIEMKEFDKTRQKEFEALDRFFAKINFETKAESILPENVDKTKRAFYELMDEMNWAALKVTFDELLDELGDKKRKDQKTPGWYHQFRQCMYDLSAYRSSLYTKENLHPHGGLEVSLIAKLRHDSYEDYGKTPVAIYAPMEGRLHELCDRGVISNEELLNARKQVGVAVEIVDLMSRKRPFFDGEKNITLEKHDGDPNEFLRGQYKYFFAFMGKLSDSVDNISTRIIRGDYLSPADQNVSLRDMLPKPFSLGTALKDAFKKAMSGFLSAFGFGNLSKVFSDAATKPKQSFSIEKNMAYVREKRGQYGRFAAYKEAINIWHTKKNQLEKPIRALDAALGVSIVINEVVNDHYVPGSKHNSANAFKIRIDQYKDAGVMFEHIPKGFNPHNNLIEELEAIAEEELEKGQYKMAALLEKSIYPAMVELGLLPASKMGSMLKFSDSMKGDVIVPVEVLEKETQEQSKFDQNPL